MHRPDVERSAEASHRAGLEWDQEEMFYNYAEWLEFLAAFLKTKGYTVSGSVTWRGEDFSDSGILSIENGKAKRAPLEPTAWASIPKQDREAVFELMRDAVYDTDDDDEKEAFSAAIIALGGTP